MPHSLFWIDSEKTFFNNALNLLPNTSFYELGILNSKISWFFLKSIASTMSGGFYQIHGHILERTPIPKATDLQKRNIASHAENCQSFAEQRYQLENDFRLEIPSLCSTNREAKLNNKLKSWWLLSFDAFKAEIKKQFKQPIPLKETRKWREWFDKSKTDIQQLSHQLASEEEKLNKAVYSLFKLNKEEIKLLEDNIK